MTDPRAGLIATARAMRPAGLNKGAAGNLSVRDGDGFLITPSGLPYDTLAPDDIPRMTPDGSHAGRRKPSSEWRLHRDLYQTKACKLLYQIFSILSRTEKSNTGIYYKDFEELLNYLDIRGTRTNDNSAINKYLVQNVIIYLSKNHLKKLSAEYDSVKQIIELTSHDDALNKIEMLAEWFRTMPDLDQIPDHEKSAIKIIEEIFVQLRELLTQFPDIANFHSIEALWFHLMNKEYLTLESENTEGIKITRFE